MVLLRYKSRDGGDRTQMEGKAQVAFIWRASSPGGAVITSLTGVGGGGGSVKETDGRVFLVCMLVDQWHNNTKTIIFTISGPFESSRCTEICNACLTFCAQ